MAFNKAKALQEAHKFVTQGKTAKAIRQYEWIIEKDPSDLILLNVIGDLYAQENNIPEALKYFYKLADAYTREGYKVKAIAIYKKISKIDRSKVEPLLRLAELNSAQGFAREAREQYRNAFEFFERAGQKDKALEILRKLCQLDPKNSGIRLRLAQYAEQAGEKREAADAYLEAADLANEDGDVAAVESALSKAAELAPENPEIHLYRARQALANQKPEDVRDILVSVPELQNNVQAKRLLLDSYLVTSDLDAARGLLLDVFQSNPLDFAPVAGFAARCIEKEQYDVALEALAGVAPELISRRNTRPLMESLRKLWEASPERTETLEFMYELAEKTAEEATIPEVLEALGTAYIQRDQFEQAEQAYARLVAREPENQTYKDLLRKVLEKQGKEFVPLSQTPFIGADISLESGPDSVQGGATAGSLSDPEQAAIVKGAITNSDFFARDGLRERAVEELEKVLRVYPDQREIHQRILEICRGKLPGRAVQAAEVLTRICAEQGESGEAKKYHEEALDLAQSAAGALQSSQDSSSDQPEGGAGLSPRPVEINLSQPAEGWGRPEEDAELPPPQEISLEFQTSRGGCPSAGSVVASVGNSEEPSLSGPPQSKTSKETPAFDYEESREEIEFYLRHGFHDEAQAAVSELERKFPTEERVAEFRQRLDQLSRESSPAGTTPVSHDEDVQKIPESEWELPTSFSAASHAGGGAGNHPVADAASAVKDIPGDDDVDSAALTSQPGPAAAPIPAADASAELGSLLDELNDSDEAADQAADDEQTHYNLGVAFREMGLLDEAIGEFQKVVKEAGNGHRGPYFLQGCTLLASCFMGKEMPTIAAKWYLRALEAPGLDHEGVLAIHYDLGTAFERAGNTAAALEKFTEVYSQNIDYRDVAEKIRLLRQASH